jgi:hypothetical protein
MKDVVQYDNLYIVKMIAIGIVTGLFLIIFCKLFIWRKIKRFLGLLPSLKN